MAQWFEGFDGQIVLDDDYVWVLREGIPIELTRGTRLPSIRAHRGAVVGTDFRPATASEPGMLRIRVSDIAGAVRPVHGSDTVRFSSISNDRFSTVNLLLAARAADTGGPVVLDESDQLRSALDSLDGIATQTELAEVLGTSPDVLRRVEGVTWNSVGALWVAAGGTVEIPEDRRLQQIRAVQDLTLRVPSNAGIKTLQNAVTTTALQHLDAQRLGGLWEAVLSEVVPLRPSVPAPRPGVVGEPQSKTVNRRGAAPAAPKHPRTRVWTKWDSSDGGIGPADPELIEQSDRRTQVNSRRRVRVHLDCDGHRVKALFDPDTEKTEITVAPARALLGSIHPDPNAAARAVVTTIRLGDDGPFDGWRLWLLDDSSGRPLGQVFGAGDQA
ncbi:MAG: hypothetical protein GX610_18945 [Rhodococcus sp.]|nr:hypothetical protein [Rhodococcus sp. (in: high G+C Gram-positive bacteria)]